MKEPAESKWHDGSGSQRDPSSSLDDRMDDALHAMWRGESAPLDDLVDEVHEPQPRVGSFLKNVMAGLSSPVPGAPLPKRIGDYEIAGKLGEGGMGVVYEARQDHPSRSVALKVIRSPAFLGASDGHAYRLFHREVQTLARLEHPGIAAIHDAGTTDEGQHYFAMELVRGEPLRQYAREHELSIRSRLQLFHRICIAMHYAHQRGVIHRDLKPGNILVDVDGNPKILDFGLAKITDADITVTTVATETGKIQGTLPYMSPEQVRGDPREINLLSDVYALGVILFELLTERLPYDLRPTLFPDALRVICEEPPHRPSTIRRELRGDLETIVLKALEKEPERRYQSAAALADDVERFLTGQPILARPPTTVYQLRKLIGRHKAPFALLTALFVLMVAFAVWMSVQYRESNRLRLAAEAARAAEQDQLRQAQENLARAMEAEREARTEARKSDRISTFLQDMLASADPERMSRRDVTVHEVLTRAAMGIDTALADEPDVEMAIRGVIGTTYKNLGRLDDAEKQLRAALATARSLQAPGRVDRRSEIAQILLDLGKVMANQDRHDEAEKSYAQAMALLRESVGANHPDSIRATAWMGMLRWRQGRFDEAEELLRKAHFQLRSTLGADAPDTIAVANDLALILNDRGRYIDAEPLFRMLLDRTLNTLGDAHPQTGRALNNLAWNLFRSGKYIEAETLYREAIELWRSILGEEHPETLLGYNNLGLVLILQGRFSEAEEVFRLALPLNRKVLGDDHSQTCGSQLGLSWALHELGRHDDAEPLLDATLTSLLQTVGRDHHLTANAYEVQARGFLLQGRFDGAEEASRHALEIRQRVLDKDHPDTLRSYNELAFALSKQEKYGEAESLFRQALEAYTRTLGETHHGTLAPMHNLAAILEKQGKLAEAAASYARVVALADSVLPEGHWNTGVFHGSYGACLAGLDRRGEAEKHLEIAVKILTAALGADHSRTEHFQEKLAALRTVRASDAPPP